MECGGNAVVDIPVSTAPGGLPYRSDRLNPSDVLSFAKQIASAMVIEKKRERERERERERGRERIKNEKD